MPSPRGSKLERSRSKKSKGSWVVPLALLLLFVVGISTLYFNAQKDTIKTSEETLCPEPFYIPEIAAVLIDVTDKTSAAEKVQITQTLTEIKESLPKFGHLRLYVLSDEMKFGQEAAVDLCNPGTGEDLSVLYQNPNLAKKRWLERFSDVLDEALSLAAAREPADSSEILEAIRSISIDFLSDPSNKNKERSLFVISDFIQHVPGKLSQYRIDQVTVEEFMVSRYSRSVSSDLRGVDIELFYIDKPQYVDYQTSQHKTFWITLLTEFGGNVKRVKKLFGG